MITHRQENPVSKKLSLYKNRLDKTQGSFVKKNKIDVLDILMTPFDEFNIYDSNEDDLFDDEN